MIRRFLATALVLVGLFPAFQADAAGQGIASHVAVCNPKFPDRCVAVAADGSIPTTGGGGGGSTSVTATAAAPTYTEGSTTNPLSTGLKGGLRVYPQTSTGQDATDTTNSAIRVNVVAGAATGVAQASTTSGQVGSLTMGATTTAAPTYTTATTNPLSLDVHGSTRVLNVDSTGTPIDPNASVAITAASLPLPAGAATSALQAGLTSAGMLRPPSAASGKLVQADVSLTTATNTTILAADANLIAIEIQCNGGPVKISAVGATLTSSAQGTGPAGTILPTANTLYTPSEASQLAYTAYQSTGSAVVCTVSKWDQ